MITHNMKAALEHGTRTIMMNEGRIIMDISRKGTRKRHRRMAGGTVRQKERR